MANDSLQDQLRKISAKQRVAEKKLGDVLPDAPIALCDDRQRCDFFAALRSGERCPGTRERPGAGDERRTEQCGVVKPRRI